MHPYMGKKAVLSTMHGKQQAIAQPFQKYLNVSIQVPHRINTDVLGTFSGEIERELTPLKTLRKKVRMGMEKQGLPLGIASEGSFGPHRYLPWVAEDHEILLWIDEDLGIEVIEQEISVETNFNTKTISSFNELKDFLDKVHFPSHALVVRPNSDRIPAFTFKGLKRVSEVREAIDLCNSVSTDGFVHVETDMRAHMNPTRMKVINKLAEKLAVRLLNVCPNCSCPGWGVIDVVPGLPCEVCGLKTKQIAKEVYGCPSCHFQKEEPRQDGVKTASPTYCDWCNP